MAVDIILLGALGAAFYGGFKTGNSFKSLNEAWKGLVARMK